MFNLISPLWLFAIAALSVPVMIHLWNVRPGKTLKVGSIALIEASSRKNSRSFNLLEILLLILRCLFLLVLAFLLAQPFYTRYLNSEKVKGWVLIPKQNLGEVYKRFKPKVDSLNKAGYELHYFNNGFAKLTDTTELQHPMDSGKTSRVKPWVLLNKLSNQVPPTLPVYLFLSNTSLNTTGARPALALNLHLQTYTPADSTSNWIQQAAFISNGNAVRITEGSSKPSGTTYSYPVVQETEQRNSPYQINVANGQPSVSFKAAKAGMADQSAMVDTSTLRIAIYSDKISDAAYLQSALDAVKQFTSRKVSVQVTTANTMLPGSPDWIFWLRERRVSLMAAENIKNVFAYEPGKIQSINSLIAIPGSDKIALAKHIVSQDSSAQVIWADGFGGPVLNVKTYHDQNIYHFYSRFDPAWNDLVWSDDFPMLMLNLLFKGQQNDAKAMVHDRRMVADNQLSPTLISGIAPMIADKLSSKTDLSKAFWIALALLFLIERAFAYHYKSAEL